MKGLKIAIIMVLGVFASAQVQAQERSIQEIHSMMVYNFMKYVNWPPTATSGEFVIGVVGESKVYQTLTKYYGTKSKGTQKIVIKEFSSASEVTDCHVIYIGKGKSGSLEDVLAKIAGKSTLIITDKAGLGKKGSGINFKNVGGKLKFELNQAAISKAKLKISSQLSGMAILI
jgi:hypothetical protein